MTGLYIEQDNRQDDCRTTLGRHADDPFSRTKRDGSEQAIAGSYFAATLRPLGMSYVIPWALPSKPTVRNRPLADVQSIQISVPIGTASLVKPGPSSIGMKSG